jgi:hypothetical protein
MQKLVRGLVPLRFQFLAFKAISSCDQLESYILSDSLVRAPDLEDMVRYMDLGSGLNRRQEFTNHACVNVIEVRVSCRWPITFPIRRTVHHCIFNDPGVAQSILRLMKLTRHVLGKVPSAALSRFGNGQRGMPGISAWHCVPL